MWCLIYNVYYLNNAIFEVVTVIFCGYVHYCSPLSLSSIAFWKVMVLIHRPNQTILLKSTRINMGQPHITITTQQCSRNNNFILLGRFLINPGMFWGTFSVKFYQMWDLLQYSSSYKYNQYYNNEY